MNAFKVAVANVLIGIGFLLSLPGLLLTDLGERLVPSPFSGFRPWPAARSSRKAGGEP